jgi:hypothetical protein
MAKDKTARFASMIELHEAILAIPPDAGASLSMPRVPASRASVPSALRTTATYGASYSHSYSEVTSVDASSSSSGSIHDSSPSSPNALAPSSSGSSSAGSSSASSSSGVSATSSTTGSSAMEKLKLSLAVAGSLLLIIAAIIALVWALTS